MKRIFKFLPIALMGMLILAGCKKDGLVTFRATTQPYDGVGKMYIENNYSCWENGDQVKINSSTATATVSTNTGNSYVELTGVAQAENYYAIYPASACAGTFGPGASITLPNVQEYRMENGRQILTAPMAAMAYDRDGDGNRVLRFQNLCLILKVHIEQKNNIIKAIRLVNPDSNSNPVPLSGSGTVTFDGTPALPTLNMVTPRYNVTLTMASGVNLNVSGGTDFYIAVPALANGVSFDIYTKDMLNQTRKLTVTTHQALHSNTIVRVDGPEQLDNDAYDLNYKYIESRDNGYIELDVKPKVGAKMELTFSITHAAAACSTQYLCGSRGPEGTGLGTLWFALGGAGTSASVTVDTGFNACLCGNVLYNSVRMGGWKREVGKIYRESVEAVQDGEYVYGIAIFENLTDELLITRTLPRYRETIPSSANNVKLFAIGNNKHKGMRCYGFTYSEGGVVMHDFVPTQVKAVGGVTDVSGSHYDQGTIGMYDMKTGKFVVPTGSGFTIGPAH